MERSPASFQGVPRGTLDSRAPECSTWNVLIPTEPKDGEDLRARARVEAEKALATSLEELEFDLEGDQQLRLIALAEMVIDWGRSTNLTGHRTPLAVTRHLIVEALALHRTIEIHLEPGRSGSRLVDLGSGAGFPGIPIAIARPELEVSLVDSRERRHHFQRAARRALGVGNLEPLLGRMEELEPVRGSLVIAQAVARSQEVLGWAAPWVQEGGTLILPGAEGAPDPGPHPGLLARGRVTYRVPGVDHARCFWSYQRSRQERTDSNFRSKPDPKRD